MREKLIELVREATDHATDICLDNRDCEYCPGRKYGTRCQDYLKADHLIANGVTLATDNNVCDKLTPTDKDICVLTHGVTVQELALPEEDYYVLRNIETGMYFRGKGVNRWGKHFNQATIYRVKGTAEHSIKEVAWHGEKAELVRIKIVEMPQPPKGE